MMKYKYPRTPHLPFSMGYSADEEDLFGGLHNFDGSPIVVTEKLDGENTTLYTDGFHARSLNSDQRSHESRDWIKNYQGLVGHTIPEGWRVCGENLYARHSIAYEGLETYFYAFSVWNENNMALTWDKTVDFLQERGIRHVPVLHKGVYNQHQLFRTLTSLANSLDTEKQEGFVVRAAYEFSYENFENYVAKWVRANHVKTDVHWFSRRVVKNTLKLKKI